MITDFGVELSVRGAQPTHSRSTCASAPFRDAIDLDLSRGRNATASWQDLVGTSGFIGSYQSVQRFVRKRRPGTSLEACAMIETARVKIMLSCASCCVRHRTARNNEEAPKTIAISPKTLLRWQKLPEFERA